MIALLLLTLWVVIVVIVGLEIVSNRYRELWLEASRLLTASDERNEELRQRVEKYATAVANKSEQVRKLKQANGQLGTQVAELGEEFRELHELGVELQKPMRQALEIERRAVHAAAVAAANQRADDAHQQIMRQVHAPPPAASSRIDQIMRLIGH